jgi:predicted  nucleic acid-binding Zn-ribbon protein
MSRGEDLYHLQQLDSEWDTRQRRLLEIEAALKDDHALREARRALETAEKQAQKWYIKQRDLELEIQSLLDKMSRSEKRLYGGKVKNPKELADLQAEVASLKRRCQKLEDTLLEAMIEREEAEETRDEAQATLDETASLWSTRQSDLKREREEVDQRLAEIRQEREAVVPRIEAGIMATYESLRDQKGGQAVARVRDDICTGCGVAISPSAEWRLRQGELCYCDTCRRMLVLM